MCRQFFLVSIFFLYCSSFAGDLAFGPDHLHLSFQDGWYKVDSKFADNRDCRKKIRYVKVSIDEKMLKTTESFFQNPPARLFQSAVSADIAIGINGGNPGFPSQVVLFRRGEVYRIVDIKQGQSPTELMRVGNAMLINPDMLAVYGMRKLVLFDISHEKPVPIDSFKFKMGTSTSSLRMGNYRNGFVVMNDLLSENIPGHIPYYFLYSLKNRKINFLCTGSVDYPQVGILQKRPLQEFRKFMKGGKSGFASNVLSNSICDGFNEFEVYILDVLNRAVLLLNTRKNRIVDYTAFEDSKFIEEWFVGNNYYCIPHFTEVKTNYFDQTVWLLHHPAMSSERKILPVSRKGRILTDNLQEIDVMGPNLKYRETIRFVPPKEYSEFYIQTMAVTGEREVVAVVYLATEKDLLEGGGGFYLTRLILQ